MDSSRPLLDLKLFEDVCHDVNGLSKLDYDSELELTCRIVQVPVIAVFTKYDQFRFDIMFKLEDVGRDPGTSLDDEVERMFHQQFLASLRGPPPFVCLQGGNFMRTGWHLLC